ncbi:hypothetical protein H632_c4679p0, partial [Helicosporidium sp. ATCC 50920]
VAATFDS